MTKPISRRVALLALVLSLPILLILLKTPAESDAHSSAMLTEQIALRATLAVGNSKGPYPGIYIFYDKYNIDPADYPHLKGGHMPFSWDDIEIEDNVFDWSGVDNWLEQETSLGKPAAVGFSLYDGRCCGGTRIPRWLVWEHEEAVVRCDALQWPIPRYGDPVLMAQYREFIQAFAARYDNDPRIAWIELATGIFGEAKPADRHNNLDDWPCMLNAGITEEVWIDYSKEVMDFFAEAFRETPLLYQFAPVYHPESKSIRQRRWLTDYAASLGIGLKHNGLTPDSNGAIVDNPEKSYYKAGFWDPFFTWWQDVPTAWESYDTAKCVDYKTGESSAGITMWCVYAGLNAHADYFVFSRGLVTDPERASYLEFANHYLGVELDETDSVWVAMREHETLPPEFEISDWFPPKGNFGQWLIQNDAAPGGRSVPDWEVTAAKEGRYTRRTSLATGNPSLYFDVDDAWLHQNANAAVTIEIIYLDRGTGSWSLHYDANANADALAGTVQKQDSGQWLTKTFELDDAYSTGSSLMPQKKNPDALELLRGKSGRMTGHLVGLLMALKGLPSTYNKDLQEDKEALFDAIDTLKLELPVATGVIDTLKLHKERIFAALDDGMLATDIADYLVGKRVPFRRSHQLVGEAVKRAEEMGCPLKDLPLSEYQRIDPIFSEDVYKVFDFARSVAARSGRGGTAPAAVRMQIEAAKESLQKS